MMWGGVFISGIGKYLKNERLKQGFNIEDVQDATKIRKKYIEAIENENFDVIKGKIYVKGFVKSYAKFLELININELMEEFEKNYPDEDNKEYHVEEKIELSKNPNKRKNFFIFAILAVITLFALHSIYNSFFQGDIVEKIESSETIVIPNPPTQNDIDEDDSLNENGDNLTEANPKEFNLTINILDISKGREACWVQVYTDGEQVFEGTMYQDDIKIFEGKETIKAVFGNAGVVNLSLGEKNLGTPGKINEVVEKNFNINDI